MLDCGLRCSQVHRPRTEVFAVYTYPLEHHVTKDELLQVLKVHVHNSLRIRLFALGCFRNWNSVSNDDSKDPGLYYVGDSFTQHNSKAPPTLLPSGTHSPSVLLDHHKSSP